MYLDGSKIMALITAYGKSKSYPEKSYVTGFCSDFNLSYQQWSAYTRGQQNIGTKIIERLIDIFPNLNLNWLLKDAPNMFTGEKDQEIIPESIEENLVEVSSAQIYRKLQDMHLTINKLASKK